MPIIIRCQSCPVLSVGGTGVAAIERFDAHELEFHNADKPAKQGATVKIQAVAVKEGAA